MAKLPQTLIKARKSIKLILCYKQAKRVRSIVYNVKCMVSGGFIPQTYQTAQK